MYSSDIQAAEIQARRDFFYQQGRISRQQREAARGSHHGVFARITRRGHGTR